MSHPHAITVFALAFGGVNAGAAALAAMVEAPATAPAPGAGRPGPNSMPTATPGPSSSSRPPAGPPGSPPARNPLTPAQVVLAAPASQWTPIAPEDLLVMELAPTPSARMPVPFAAAFAGAEPSATDAATPLPVPAGPPRRIVIQLVLPPYSQGWVHNIRRLAAAHWWDGQAITRVQDNYVVQWGGAPDQPAPQPPAPANAASTVPTPSLQQIDPDSASADAPLRFGPPPLPPGLQKMPPADYVAGAPGDCGQFASICPPASLAYFTSDAIRDAYADSAGFVAGWPVAVVGARSWPVHCYSTVGVGRDLTPDTGNGTELYAVIGHAPRQLDRNIAVVGRVIEGIEHLSALPRGTGALGFYETPAERTPILSIRLGSEVPDLPRYEYLATNSSSFAAYLHARANRQDDFYSQPAGGVDVCNVPVPIRQAAPPQAPPAARRRTR